ncbi:prepilin peptidase [Acanthopleuribacter pedis]|uniref:Prepilin peptidase n=1 Tax=Acanthopleuribacter pedis TaxID=442870 RepID=A0A8J7Q1U4_9BACT|nr:A24 family peptidase [Acanthopleuribacter pedis]MBO1318907.1 prepilin peptidase [Acanthopleuribacter pedis]
MNNVVLIVTLIAGALVGHGIRYLVPRALKLKDKKPVFMFPWVELVTAGLFLLVAWRLGYGIAQLKWFFLTSVFVAIAVSDYATKYIPDSFTLYTAPVGMACTILFPQDVIAMLGHERLLLMFGVPPHQELTAGIMLAITGAAAGFMMMEVIRRIFSSLLQMEAMGLGDAYLMLTAGAFLGPQMVCFSLLPACLIGVITGLIWKLLFKTPHAPFGPALGMGCFSMLLFRDELINGFIHYNEALYDLPPQALMAISLVLIGVVFFLVIRMKRRAAQYEAEIEEDYDQMNDKFES